MDTEPLVSSKLVDTEPLVSSAVDTEPLVSSKLVEGYFEVGGMPGPKQKAVHFSTAHNFYGHTPPPKDQGWAGERDGLNSSNSKGTNSKGTSAKEKGKGQKDGNNHGARINKNNNWCRGSHSHYIVHVITAEASLSTLITTHISAYLPPLLPMLAGPVRNLYISPSR